jgi:hypothetical protein
MSRAKLPLPTGFLLLVPMALLAAACTGPAGEPGLAGAPGEPGSPGAACWDLDRNGACDLATEDLNQDGVCDVLDCRGEVGGSGGAGGVGGAGGSGAVPETPYVGTAVCELCHLDKVTEANLSGHFSALSPPEGGQRPTRPYDSITNGVPAPPLSTPWTDISYVVGGFAWRAIYVKNDGYVLTGASATDATQWNFANGEVGTTASWALYHAGEETPFDCGKCHATGWIPCAIGDPSCQHQDGMPGMAGSFYAPGVQCEACHGPAIEHASSPYFAKPAIDRSTEACGKCHGLDPADKIQAGGGFITSGQQYNQLFGSKKRIMRCVDCHDPHQSTMFADPVVNPAQGLRGTCLDCHEGYDTKQNSTWMPILHIACVDCHMPPMSRSAAGNLTRFTADLPSHLFGINPAQGAPQFYSVDGQDYSQPYLTLDYACNYCHQGGYPPATLEATATGYHQ